MPYTVVQWFIMNGMPYTVVQWFIMNGMPYTVVQWFIMNGMPYTVVLVHVHTSNPSNRSSSSLRVRETYKESPCLNL